MVEMLKYHSRSSGLRCTFPLVPVELPPPVRNRGESGITLAKNHWQPLSRFENNNNSTISTLFLLQFVLCAMEREKHGFAIFNLSHALWPKSRFESIF